MLLRHIQFFVCLFVSQTGCISEVVSQRGGVEAEQTAKGEIPASLEMQLKGLQGKFPLELVLINFPVPLRRTFPWEAIL